ncbi:hypothetical protein [Nocardia sp. R6R-6]|uniref:hypothetical protein n=1 Tax=Nocardia sp. R6R-6 TaxID=3459303 RepID=UPI00403D9042
MTEKAGRQNLQQLIEGAGGAAKLLRGNKMGLPTQGYALTPLEFTNWRDEQRAWKDSVALLELSYFMTELHLRGPEVIAFLKTLAVNKFDPFKVRRAKQIVLAGHDGNMLSDGIIFHEEEDFYRIVGLSPAVDEWVLYNAADSSFDFTIEHKDLSLPRDVFRMQVQGPYALSLVTEVAGGSLPDVSFFGIGEFQIAGKNVRALRHGMAGTAGFEIYGPWQHHDAVREALEEAGEKYGLRKAGDAAYRSTAQESGWLAEPLPAIYSGDAFKAFRETLDATSYAAIGSLGGSYVSDRVEDYYVDPVEAGYSWLIDWDRDFVGRDALQAKADNQHRQKVTLEWNDADVASALASTLFGPGPGARFIGLPTPLNSFYTADSVLMNGEHIGVSQWASYTANARHVISTALVANEYAEPGTELTLLWGEPDSMRLPVDAHEVREIRVTVTPSPYFEKVIKAGKQ